MSLKSNVEKVTLFIWIEYHVAVLEEYLIITRSITKKSKNNHTEMRLLMMFKHLPPYDYFRI